MAGSPKDITHICLAHNVQKWCRGAEKTKSGKSCACRVGGHCVWFAAPRQAISQAGTWVTQAMYATSAVREPSFTDKRKRVLVLYDHNWLHVNTIAHYLESFHRYSEFAVSYVSSFAPCAFDLDYFDAVVIHYSVKVCYPGHLSRSFEKALRRYHGVKVLFLQDEYEATDAACRAIADLGIGIVFTCVPAEFVERVYPRDRCGDVEFVQVLTGYVPTDIDTVGPIQPIRQRPLLIGYRGRNNGFWYGDLYQEKVTIGRRM
jgi:hypothetical protein